MGQRGHRCVVIRDWNGQIIENADATPPHLDVFVRLGSSVGMLCFCSCFALRLHSSVLRFEHCGVLWECFGEPGDPFVLNLRLWRAPVEPSGPHLEYENKKDR